MRYSLPGSPFLHQCLTLFHSSTGSAGVTSRSLTNDLTKNKPPGVSTHRPPLPFAFNWRERLLGLGLAQGTSCSTWHFWGGWAGNRCLQYPLSLVLNPVRGWGKIGMLAFQYRHEAPPWSHVPRPLIWWVIQSVGSIHALLHFPYPISPTKAVQIIFILFFIPLMG